jgi:predicted permease
MDALISDIRYALRTLAKAPGFAVVAVLTLALGIGANTAIFSVVNTLLWRPLPAAHPEELVVLAAHARQSDFWGDYSYVDYRDFSAADVFAGVIAYYPIPLSVSLAGANERASAEIVSGNYFTMLGVRPAVGRGFGPDVDTTRAPVVVISDALWRHRFGGSQDVVGQPLRANGQTYTIVGVAPPEFHGVYYPGFRPDMWIPASLFDQVVPGVPGRLATRGATTFRQMGRLKPGVSVAAAQAAVASIGRRLETDFPQVNGGVSAALFAERDARPEPGMGQGFAMANKLFLLAVGLVLLIACANVASLILARATGRHREVGIRLALGGSRARLVRQLLTESLVLAALGGAGGVMLAVWITGALGAALRLPTDFPFVFEFAVDYHVLLYAFGVSLATGLLFGLAPALQASGGSLVGALKVDGITAGGTHRSRLRAAMVTGQIALSFVLLVGAGLTVRTLRAVKTVQPGFDPHGGLLVSFAPGLQQYTRSQADRLYANVLQRVRQIPGVAAASLAQFVPLEFSGSGGAVLIDGRDNPPGGEVLGWSVVTPGYLATMRTALVDGRDFAAADDSAAQPVVIVNRTAAQRFWPGASAIGRTLRFTAAGPAVTVVGVTEDGKYRNLTETPRPYLFLPLAQNYRGSVTLVVRTGGNPMDLVPPVRQAFAVLDPEMPLFDVKTLEGLIVGRALLGPRIAAQMAGVLGLLALALTVVGLYGVVAYAASRRAREFGIRMALGARPADVLALVLRQGVRLVAIGVGAGAVAALGVSRALRSLLFGVGTTDPLTYGAAVAVLTAVALAAAYLPARRATKVDPMVALRYE